MPTYRSMRGAVYSRTERADLIEGFYAAFAQRVASIETRDDAGRAAAESVMASTSDTYREATPIVSLSRSPLTGAVFETSLDIFGIDGLWWSYEDNYRPFVEPIATFFAWSGSMQIDEPLPNRPLKSMVGPSAPFVLPRLLRNASVCAVVSSVLIGASVGYPVVYFARPTPYDIERADDWGHDSYGFETIDGSYRVAHAIEDDTEKDLDLAPWIHTGKLLWIAPGDLDLQLRSTVDDCPFVAVGGERHRQYIQRGRLWTAHDREFRKR